MKREPGDRTDVRPGGASGLTEATDDLLGGSSDHLVADGFGGVSGPMGDGEGGPTAGD